MLKQLEYFNQRVVIFIFDEKLQRTIHKIWPYVSESLLNTSKDDWPVEFKNDVAIKKELQS